MGHSAGRGGVMKVDTCALDFCACNTEKEKYSPAVTCHELLDGSSRFYLFRCRLLSSVSLAVVVTTLAAVDAGLSPSLAQCAGAADNTTCTPGGNDYTSGINVSTSNTPIAVTLQPGVEVVIPSFSGVVNSVNLANTTAPFTPEADATLTVNSAFIDNTAVSGPNKSGLRIQASGNATITATDTEVHVTGLQSTNAIWAIVLQSSNPNISGNRKL